MTYELQLVKANIVTDFLRETTAAIKRRCVIEHAPYSACAAPTWQRQPARVTFQSSSGEKLSFTLRGQMAGEISPAQDEDPDGSK